MSSLIKYTRNRRRYLDFEPHLLQLSFFSPFLALRHFLSRPVDLHSFTTGIPTLSVALVPARQRPGPGWRAGWLWAASLALGWGGCSWWGECFSSRPPGNQPYAHMRPPAGSHLGWCQTSPEEGGKGADGVKENGKETCRGQRDKAVLQRDFTIKACRRRTFKLCTKKSRRSLCAQNVRDMLAILKR